MSISIVQRLRSVRRRALRAIYGPMQPEPKKTGPNWSRVVMNRKLFELVSELGPTELDVLEVSGETFPAVDFFASYRRTEYPDFDICTDILPERFDLIVANQVFEHLLWPYRAGRNVFQMLRSPGWFLIATPFLLRIHPGPHDCSRWTETGLRYFLAECGFDLDMIQTDSWGNRSCVRANLDGFVSYEPDHHSLENEPDVPYHVWALAKKS